MLTKIQYNNYEPGEFTDMEERTVEEAILLIESFPWDQQREHFSIGLTGPSVTIESIDHQYLKLIPWYHGKFILQYFNALKQLYSHSFNSPPDAIPFIRCFFDSPSLDTTAFRHETTWFSNPAGHFRTRDFQYSLSWRRILPVVLLLVVFLWPLLTMSFLGLEVPSFGHFLLLIPAVFCVYYLRLISVIVNHYRASEGKVLILSKGKDDFAYGPANDPIPLRKQDIRSIVTYGRVNRGGYPSWTKVKITFKDGRSIDISCLLIEHDKLIGKFPGRTSSVIKKFFPFMPPSAASTLSV